MSVGMKDGGDKRTINCVYKDGVAASILSVEAVCHCQSKAGVIAHDKEELQGLGITHILNAAHGAWDSRGCQDFYGQEIHYHGIAAEDAPDFDLSVHFRPASEYIHKALSAPQGKVLVHCILGKSRSATLVLAYLMIYQNFSLRDAVERVLQHRAISPNQGFLKQLQDLDLELRYKISPCQLLNTTGSARQQKSGMNWASKNSSKLESKMHYQTPALSELQRLIWRRGGSDNHVDQVWPNLYLGDA
ncbi:UNVERIFIED_CONTAM: hypothetical protein K2H54_003943, partial [Gekko kuhli]